MRVIREARESRRVFVAHQADALQAVKAEVNPLAHGALHPRPNRCSRATGVEGARERLRLRQRDQIVHRARQRLVVRASRKADKSVYCNIAHAALVGASVLRCCPVG
eukprot:7390451-Prymnesium_polylepis.1